LIETQCRCGAAKLTVDGEPAVQIYCHCDDCQSAHGGAYVASAIYPARAVAVTEGATQTSAVRETPRVRCQACGEHLYSELARVGMRSVNAYLLPKGVFRAQFHVQCQHAVRPIVDNLPHYRGFPAVFGGKEEFVDW
jgi:hypothetical protein